jgi:hypothetical protein
VNKELAKIRKKFTSSKTLSEYDRKKYAPFPAAPRPLYTARRSSVPHLPLRPLRLTRSRTGEERRGRSEVVHNGWIRDECWHTDSVRDATSCAADGPDGLCCCGSRDVRNGDRYVWKLLYIFMLGYEVDFGHMEALSLISCNQYAEKQVCVPALVPTDQSQRRAQGRRADARGGCSGGPTSRAQCRACPRVSVRSGPA